MELSFIGIIELVAVVTGGLYTFLAGRSKLIAWLFAIISAGIYTYINYTVQLYFFAVLQFLYVAIAVYGWFEWKTKEQVLQFRFLKLKNIPIILVGLVISVGLAHLASTFTNQQMPYFDAINFVFCLIASYMITQKIMEAWLYLFVMNCISLYMYFTLKLYPSAILYVLLTLLAVNAFRDWWLVYKRNNGQYA